MNSYHRSAAMAITASAALAIFATSAGAWDQLPCGATEAAAHACAPGEVARDGTIPNPAPVAVAPLATPAPAPDSIPTPGLVVTPPQPPAPALTCARLPRGAGPTWRHKAHCTSITPPPPTCADLEARKAGRAWFSKFKCDIPLRLRRVGPFESGFPG